MARKPSAASSRSDDALLEMTRPVRGPLPAASELERIEALCPGATDRIITLVEAQQAHRLAWEKGFQQAYANERRRAQFCALAFALSGLAAAVVFGIVGEQTAATVVGSTTIGGVVATFILGGQPRTNSPKPPE
jgi:uncharacterized membrane protein